MFVGRGNSAVVTAGGQDIARNTPWTPALLFDGSVKGLWIDPQDRSTLFQDTAGATPVTDLGQSIARINDKSGQGNHFTQGTALSRPQYNWDDQQQEYLYFDGVNDWLSAAAYNWGVDAVTVVAAFTRRQSAVTEELLGISTTPTSANGSFVLAPTSDTASNNAGFASKGTGTNALARAGSTLVGSTPYVFTGIGDISADTCLIRRNGLQIGTSANDQGTGNYGNYPMYLGSRGGASRFYRGELYALFAIGRVLTAPELVYAERWAASKCGVTL